MFQRLLSNTHRTATRTVQRAVSTPNRAPFTNVLPYQNFVKTRIFSSTALKSTSRSTSYFQHSKVKASESMANESMAPVHLLGIVGVLALSGVLYYQQRWQKILRNLPSRPPIRPTLIII